MIPANPRLLKCPHCGGEKPVLSLMSGNTFGGRKWSDTKGEYPMLPRVSAVQKCPHCGKYYFTNEAFTGRTQEGYGGETGQLDYQQALEAFRQLDPETRSRELRAQMLLELLWAWNDHFSRRGENVPSEEDLALFRSCADELIGIRTVRISRNFFGRKKEETVPPDLLCCELHRECGRFDECLEILAALKPTMDDNLLKVAAQIESHAREGDCRVFVLEFGD